MRQAGRYLPEYRALRQRHSLLELCHKPELAAQVTLQPVERLGVDAAILFADILLPFEPLGLGLSFSAGEGPQITRPIREAGQVLELPPVDPATDLAYVRSEEHTSELQSLRHLVCRLLLEKKNAHAPQRPNGEKSTLGR